MAIKVIAEFIFTEDEFEALSFEKQGDILDNMLKHSDWDVDVVKIEMSECNTEWEDGMFDED